MKLDRTPVDEAISRMFGNPRYVSNYVFYAHMISQCNLIITTNIETASVSFNGKSYDLSVNPDFFAKFEINVRIGVLAHEMQHILQGHMYRVQERDHSLFNKAADCAINQLIPFKDLPKDHISPETLKEDGLNFPLNLSAEQYYELFKEEQEKNEDKTSSKKVLDDHSSWSKNSSTAVNTDAFQKEVTKQLIEKAAAETIKDNGDLPVNYSKSLEIHSNVSQVNWKTVLKNIVSNKKSKSRSTLKRKNRRFPGRPDLRGKTRDRSFELLVVLDVSGSMTDESLVSVLGEIKQICKMTKTSSKMIQVDSEARDPEEISTTTLSIERKGNGGTYLAQALDKAEEFKLYYDAIVVCTDGYLMEKDVDAFKATNKKVVWLIEKTGRIMESMNSICNLKSQAILLNI